MLGRQHYGRRTVNSVDACCEHTYLLVAVLDREIDVRAFTATDPIALSFQNIIGPTRFEPFNVRDELFRVVRNTQKPLFQISLLNGSAATPTDPARRLFVRGHSFFFG